MSMTGCYADLKYCSYVLSCFVLFFCTFFCLCCLSQEKNLTGTPKFVYLIFNAAIDEAFTVNKSATMCKLCATYEDACINTSSALAQLQESQKATRTRKTDSGREETFLLSATFQHYPIKRGVCKSPN